MATAKEQLLSSMSPQMARLLDEQLAGQQAAQNAPRGYAGLVGEAARGTAMLGNIGRDMFGLRPQPGMNEQQVMREQQALAAQQQAQQAQESQEQQDLEILKKQAEEAILASPEIGERKASAMLKAIRSDKTGQLSNSVVSKFATDAMNAKVDVKDPYGHLVVTGNRVFNKKTQSYIEPPSDKDGKPQKMTDVAETYGVDVTKLAPDEKAKLGIIASQLATEGKNPNEIQAALNGEIVSMFDKKKKADANQKDSALRAQLSSLDSLISSAKQARDMAPESFADASVNAIAGFLGVPWTEGLTLENYVTQIKSNLAFDRLQAMRDASKTGGALGQVSNIELKLLESNLTALDPKDANFKQQLETVIKHYEAFSAALRGRVPSGYKEVNGRIFSEDSDGTWYEIKGA